MSWFTAYDKLALQEVSESLLTEQFVLLRSNGSEYAEVEVAAPLPCRIFPPGVMKAELRSLVPHLRGTTLGAIEVRASEEIALSIAAKDRLRVKTQGDRLFEVIAPLSARTVEIRRKLIVREINLPERVLYLALRPEGYDGASSDEPLPELVKVIPHAYITDKPVEMVKESDGSGYEAANLKQIMAAEIARSFFSNENLSRLLYCLIVPSDVTVTAEQAQARVYPRYRFNGSPSSENYKWSDNDFAYSVGLIEER